MHALAIATLFTGITLASLWTFYTNLVTVCTWLHNILPPWDFLDQFPTAQKYYKVFVYLIGYAAGSARSTIWGSISTKNGSQPSAASQRSSKTDGGSYPEGQG